MKITEVRCYLAADSAGELARRGWVTKALVANPMSVHPAYAKERRTWMGLGQEHYAVEIHTDGGIVGVCANYYGGALACAIIDGHLRRFLVGQDPFDIARLWDQMYRATLPYGLGAVTGMALAGVDLALWDLVGKAVGQPVFRLIGGATKPDGIPCYVTTHPDHAPLWAERGFQGVKVAAPYGVESGRDGILGMSRMLATLREAVGEKPELMVDCYMSWSADFAARVADRVRRYDIRWFEDPLPSGWSAAEYARLRSAVSPIQITNGNLEFHYKAFFDLLDHRASDVIQPELHWCGGLTPALWIAAYAKRHDVPIVPHGPSVYPLHLTMATTNAPYAEFVAGGDGTEVRSVFGLLLDQPLPVDGRVHLPVDRPGFGVRLDHERLLPYGGAA